MLRDQVRQIDRIAIDEFGMLGMVLMENAGRGAAEAIAGFLAPGTPVSIVCGKGNNGGDGYVIARHLELIGFPAQIWSLVELDELAGDARANAEIAVKAGFSIRVLRDASEFVVEAPNECVVDCMLGTGASGAPRGVYADLIRRINGCAGKRVAIDIPSGLDCDTGQANDPTFRADLTVTFVARKDGFDRPGADAWIGRVCVVGIGIPKKLLDRSATS